MERWFDRAALASLVIASTWFAVAAGWEIAGPFDAGHDAANAYVGIAAVEMQRWGWVPVIRFLEAAPLSDDLYYHHPWATRWIAGLLVWVFGAHEWVVRLPPVAMSAATPPIIFWGARRLWGTAPAALAACAFAVTPIAVAFADFNNFEVPSMFGVALMSWTLIRLRQTPKRRCLVGSLLALIFLLNTDWSAYVFVGVVLGFGFVRGTVSSRRWFVPVDRRRFWLWWGLSVLVVGVVAVFYLATFGRLQLLDELLFMGKARSVGAVQPLAAVLASRRHWIEFSFTPVGIALGKLALPVLLVRVLWLRRDLEVLPIAVLVMAAFHYVVFKQAADLHVFWSQYFSLYLAYGVGALAASGREAFALLPSASRWRTWGRHAVFVAGLVPLVVMAPDAAYALGFARRTGKRFDDGFRLIHQDADKMAVARLLRGELAAGQTVAVHDSAEYSWALEWAFRRPVCWSGHLSEPDAPLFLDARFADPPLLESLVAHETVRAYGPFWFTREAERPAPLEAFRLVRAEPGWWEWYWINANDPFFSVVSDPFLTWELRDHYQVVPNELPVGVEPTDSEQLRVAHNMALAVGDASRAARLRKQLLLGLRRIAWDHADGVRLLGYEWLPGVAPRVRVFVEAAGATVSPVRVEVTSVVLERPWSTVPRPTRVRPVGMPFALPSTRWKPGFLYASESEIREQPGIEEYRVRLVAASWTSELVPIFTY